MDFRKLLGPIWDLALKRVSKFVIPEFRDTLWYQKSRNAGTSCILQKYILLQTQWENLASLCNLRTGLRRSRRTGLKIKGDWYKADFTQLRRPIFELCFNRWPSTKQLEMYKMPRKFDTCYGLLPMLTETQWGQSLYISISNKNDLIILKVAIISFSICWFVKVLLGKCALVF